MTRTALSPSRQRCVWVLALILALAVMVWSPDAHAQGEGSGEGTALPLDNAEFRWGLNSESAGYKTHFGHNFFSSGNVSEVLTGAGQQLAEEQWVRSMGNVRIERAPGVLATWGDATPSGSASSDIEMVFTKGTGTVDVASGTASISWTGTASVLYYSGQSVFSISDPKLSIENGAAEVKATLNGIKSAQGSSEWKKLDSKPDVAIAKIALGKDAINSIGFSKAPKYEGEKYSGGDQRGEKHFGSFPQPFVDYLVDTGLGGYFYSTGGVADQKKLPLPVTVSWDSDKRTDAATGGGTKGILGQVIDDTVEDILQSAGTDVADTAAAWMDEAWKPLQPDAVKAAQEAQAPGDAATPTDTTVEGEAVVDEEFDYQYQANYSSDTPMTAGTVGSVAALSPATPSGSPSVPSNSAAANTAPDSVADQDTMPVAANLPLTDVVYSNTSASSDAGNTLPQWQWWVGGVLLALAAGLFYQTVPRKD